MRQLAAMVIAGGLALAGCSGSSGKDGTSCRVDNEGGTATIRCSDGTSVAVPTPPADTTCTVTPNQDGTKTVRCSDGSTVVVRDAVRDFSAMTTADKLDLDPSIVVSSVTIPVDGRPVVSFVVNDRNGNRVKNAIPLDSAGKPLSGWTVRFGVAQLAPAGAVNNGANETWVVYNTTTVNPSQATSSYEVPGTASTSAGTPVGVLPALTDNGDGSYTFRFAKDVTTAALNPIAFDSSRVHRLVGLVYQSGNPFAPMNAVYDFVPSAPVATQARNPDDSSPIDPASCLECHSRFRAKAGTTGVFHGGGRYDVRGCVLCHNDQRRYTTLSATTVDADAPGVITVDGGGVMSWTGSLALINGQAMMALPVFIHKIHMGEELKLGGGKYVGFSGAEQPNHFTYPQNVKNCAKCHRTTAKADAWKTGASRRACGACHDDITFAYSGGAVPVGRRTHTGGVKTSDLATGTSNSCNGCHSAASVEGYHAPVIPPHPENYYVNTTVPLTADLHSTGNVNAGWVPSTGYLPPGAAEIVYDVSEVSTTSTGQPVMKFKFKKRVPVNEDGTPGETAFTDVVFADSTVATEMIPGFMNSPSLYFAYAVPQDGIAAPQDFNATASVYLKNLWKRNGGTLAGPDSKGYYTGTLTSSSARIPSNARMLVGGIGYSYGLSTTPPLTQTNLAAFPVDANVVPGSADPNITWKKGGLVVTAQDATRVAKNHVARRTIVAVDRCDKCHDGLGVGPVFHVGQRNDSPTCTWCHSANRTNSGWSVNADSFIHAIHGGAKRDVPFNYYSSSPTAGYFNITYPGVLRNCEQCHVPGGYDFSNPVANDTVGSLLPSTVSAYGTTLYSFRISPFIEDAVTGLTTTMFTSAETDYTVGMGYGFATSNRTVNDNRVLTAGATQKVAGVTNNCTVGAPCTCTAAQPCTQTCSTAAPCEADSWTRVNSPVVNVCVACHTTTVARSHMTAMGGSFYEPRATALGKEDTCLMCHGPGKVAAISDVHMSK